MPSRRDVSPPGDKFLMSPHAVQCPPVPRILPVTTGALPSPKTLVRKAAKFGLQGWRAGEKILSQEGDSPGWGYLEKKKYTFMSLFQIACGCFWESPESPSLLFCIYLTFPQRTWSPSPMVSNWAPKKIIKLIKKKNNRIKHLCTAARVQESRGQSPEQPAPCPCVCVSMCPF